VSMGGEGGSESATTKTVFKSSSVEISNNRLIDS